MQFDWDQDKARKNLAKHGIPFEDAVDVFFDPYRYEIAQDTEAFDEERWLTVGHVDLFLLAVVYTVRGVNDHCYRIISARKA